jgi:small subunit ribosomal protein S6e
MVEFRLVLSQKGRSKQIEVKDDSAQNLIGKKIGDIINGELFDLAGYEFKITGGSDSAGKAMRADVSGMGRKKILTISGIGVKKISKGTRQRKLVAGNTIHEKTAQINMAVVKQGKTPLFEDKKEEPKEAKETKEKVEKKE